MCALSSVFAGSDARATLGVALLFAWSHAACASLVDPSDPSGDATRVRFRLRATQYAQDCMPSVEPDPLRFVGVLTVTNATDASVGPVRVSSARVLDGAGAERARFELESFTLGAVAAGSSASVTVTKRGESLSPARGCFARSCSEPTRVVLALEGPNVPPGATVESPAQPVECSH